MANEAEAFESEIALIDLFGRKDLGTGCLINHSDGGEGLANPDAKTRRRMSDAKTGKSAGMLGKHHSESSRNQMSAAHAGMTPPSRKGCIPWNKGKTGGVWTAARRKTQENKKCRTSMELQM
jgi:hypothetical protein